MTLKFPVFSSLLLNCDVAKGSDPLYVILIKDEKNSLKCVVWNGGAPKLSSAKILGTI